MVVCLDDGDAVLVLLGEKVLVVGLSLGGREFAQGTMEGTGRRCVLFGETARVRHAWLRIVSIFRFCQHFILPKENKMFHSNAHRLVKKYIIYFI
jgi:hypothetical protein